MKKMRKISSFSTALRRYFHVILALLRREEEIRRRAPLESILEMLEPIVLIGTLSFFKFLLDARGAGPLGGSPVLFYASGFFPKYLFIYISRYMPRGSPLRRFPTEQRLDYMIVHIILRLLDYAVLGFFLFGFIYLFLTDAAMPYNVVPLVPALIAIVMLGFGWGVLNLVLIQKIWIWQFFLIGINRALLIISGALFVPDFLPPGIRYVLSFNPVMHAIALFRTGFYPHYPTLLLDTTYMACCAIFALLLGLVLERVTRRTEGQ